MPNSEAKRRRYVECLAGSPGPGTSDAVEDSFADLLLIPQIRPWRPRLSLCSEIGSYALGQDWLRQGHSYPIWQRRWGKPGEVAPLMMTVGRTFYAKPSSILAMLVPSCLYIDGPCWI